MVIEVFADGLDRAHVNTENRRISCRAVVLRQESEILGEYHPGRDVFNLPGGGLEPDETSEACVVREVLEETGVSVRVLFPTVTVIEYFPEGTFESRFFRCEETGLPSVPPARTEEEIRNRMENRWYGLYEFLEILETYESTDPFGPNVHQRELIGLLNSI